MLKDEKSIQALVRLIEDPDESIYGHVKDKLVNCGPSVIPFLESSWEEEDYGLLFQSRIENLIQEIQYTSIKDKLKQWINSSHKDLLTGALIISRYQYPNFDESSVRNFIQEIRNDIWLELNEGQTAYEKVAIFNKIFYGKYKFQGNSKDYHSPLNSCLNTVLEMRKGNPLSLCIIYSTIAQSLNMPIYGVNLPNHFVLSYLDQGNINTIINSPNKYGSLFYINPFSKGGIFNENEIHDFLKSLDKPAQRNYFEPCSNSAILVRMLTNLISSFQQVGNVEKIKEITELRNLFNLNG
ncbi:MAG: transglutaminase-like domain-containing protein [Crocinitomicaceae bacterium]|nr:transglutaminase-like domain-containing protein [Crocinitomicaceae bacterium]